jgi:hypothetical protein
VGASVATAGWTAKGIGARIALLAVVAAFGTLVAPGTASAQFGGSSQDYCADRSPYKAPPPGFDSHHDLTITVSGNGSVSPSMYGTPANCITLKSCSGSSCTYDVQTVCAFHCYSHLHLDPQHWDVRLAPTPNSGSQFLGWSTSADPCRPPSNASFQRTDCLQLMDRPRTVTATFGPAGTDTVAPTAPNVTVTPAPYRLGITWTASSDQYLAGYEVWLGTKLLGRTDKGTLKWTAQNLSCGTSYAVRVVAFDATNETSSADVSTATPSCAVAAPPRPNTVLHVKPPRTTKSRTAFFHFGVRGEIAATRGYRCKLDKGRWTRCSGVNGKRYRKLKKGYHTFQVRAGNAAGWDKTPAKWRWRIR